MITFHFCHNINEKIFVKQWKIKKDQKLSKKKKIYCKSTNTKTLLKTKLFSSIIINSVNRKDSQRYWRGYWKIGKRWDGKLAGAGRENSQDLLCVNCRIIRQAPKRTWHLAPKGGACVQERFVALTYCRCQHTLNYAAPALRARRSEPSQTAPNSAPWQEITGNYTFSARVINYYNHLLHTALLSIPPG